MAKQENKVKCNLELDIIAVDGHPTYLGYQKINYCSSGV